MDLYCPGDQVLIANVHELEDILERFCPTLECIKPLTIEEIADQYATVLDIIVPPESAFSIEHFAVLVLEDGRDLVLPLSGFRKVKVEIDELEESQPFLPISKSNPAVLSQDLYLVQTVAAESIQAAYRRYRDCKDDIKARRMKSTEQLVLNMAAETIARNLKRVVSKVKSQKSLESLKSSQNNSLQIIPPQVDKQESPRITPVIVQSPRKEEMNAPVIPVVPLDIPKKAEVPSIPRKTGHNSKDILLLSLQNISVSGLANVAWNEKNNLYIIIENQSWLYKTDVLMDSGENGYWKGTIANLDLRPLSPRFNSPSSLKFYVYHSCWAIQDKLIGFCEIPLSYFDSTSSSAMNINSYANSLFDSTSLVKRKMRGNISFNWTFIYDEHATTPNLSPRIKEENSRISTTFDKLDGNSVVSKYVDVSDNISQNINGFSPSEIVDAANLLNDWEEGRDTKATNYKPAIPKNPKIPKIPLEEVAKAEEKAKKSQKTKDLVTTPHSIVSNITDENNAPHPPQDQADLNHLDRIKEKPKKSILHAKERRASKPETKPMPPDPPMRTVVTPSEPSFHIEHHIQYVFDQAFYFSLLKLSTNFSMTLKEFVILLDSMEVPISDPYQSYLLPSSPRHEDKDSSRRGYTRGNKGYQNSDEDNEIICFPINHPSAFAASLVDLLTTRYSQIVKEEYQNNLSDFLTPKKLTQCIKNLIHLLKIEYLNIRGMILLACAGKSHLITGQEEPTNSAQNPSIDNKDRKKILSSKLSFTSTNSNSIQQEYMTLNESITKRPSQFSPPVMKSIILSMNLFGNTSSSSSASTSSQQVDLPSFLDALNGKDFPQLTTKETKKKLKIKSSVLISRLELYQSTLSIIDSCWDRGIRPQDKPLSISQHNISSASPSTTANNLLLRSISRQIVEKTRSIDTSSFNNTHTSSPFGNTNTNNNNNNQNHNNNSKGNLKASSSLHNEEPVLFTIHESNDLFQSYLSYNRAFGWNFTINFLTILANNISGLYCYQIQDVKQLAVNELNDLYSQSSASNNNDNLKNSLKNDFLWVSIVFPSDEIYHQMMKSMKMMIDQQQQQMSTGNGRGNSSVTVPIYQLIELRNNTNEIFIHIPKSCLTKTSSIPKKTRKQSTSTGNNNTTTTDPVDNNSRKARLFSVSSSSTHSHTTTLNELYQLFYTINHNTIPMNSISIGMKAKIVSFQVLQRLIHSKFDWWDRPNDETLQKLANKTCEIISLNDLYSDKKRIGIKLINTNICDALPYEALLPYYEEDHNENDDENHHNAVKRKKTLSKEIDFATIRKTVSQGYERIRKIYTNPSDDDDDPSLDEEAKERKRLKRAKKLRKLLKKKKLLEKQQKEQKEQKAQQEQKLKEEQQLKELEQKAAMKLKTITKLHDESPHLTPEVERKGNDLLLTPSSLQQQFLPNHDPALQIKKKSLHSTSLDPAAVTTSNSTTTTNKGKTAGAHHKQTGNKLPQQQQQQHQPHQKEKDSDAITLDEDLFLQIPPVGGDEALPDLEEGGEDLENGPASTPFRIYVEKKSQEKQENEKQKQLKKEKLQLKLKQNPILLPEDKDYSWLRTSNERPKSSSSAAPSKGNTHLIVENLEDENSPSSSPVIRSPGGIVIVPPLNIPPLPSPGDEGGPPVSQIHHLRQAEFETENIQYYPGVYKYPTEPKDPKDSKDSKIRPKSAITQKKKEMMTNNHSPRDDIPRRPKTTGGGSGGTTMQLSGLGYDAEGKLRELNSDEEEMLLRNADENKLSPRGTSPSSAGPIGGPRRPTTSPSSSPTRPQSAATKYSTNRTIKHTQKYFENQDKEQQQDLKLAQQHHLNIQNFEMNISNNIIQPNPAATLEKKKTLSKKKKTDHQDQKKIDREEGEGGGGGGDVDKNEEEDGGEDKAIQFKVDVKKPSLASPKNRKQQSLKEALLYEREMIRSQKEAEKKENYLLKELKKLGVDTTKIQI